ncbi:MAG TPA: chitinase [Anaerolineales bacterium]|nr:chitinase [Anaerolineales bacterium]
MMVTTPDAASRDMCGPRKSGGLPRHLLIGYWHNWQSDKPTYIPLKDVSDRFDVIHVAFATAAETHDGTMTFVPDPQTSARQFKADIGSLKGKGKKVVISVGGATGSVAIADPDAKRNFVDSMTAIVRDFGFDGIDINMEGQVRLDPGDLDYKNPTSPSITYLIAAIRSIRQNFGRDFILSMTPETLTAQGGYCDYREGWGSYLPVIDGARDIITYVQVQHYNSGSMTALDGREYCQGTADFHVAMSEMLLRGFPVKSKLERFFLPIRPDQLIIGLPASDKITNDGYTSPDDVRKALNYISNGQDFGGAYVLRNSAGYPGIRGVMTWSINWDAATRFEFSRTTRAYLDGLP